MCHLRRCVPGWLVLAAACDGAAERAPTPPEMPRVRDGGGREETAFFVELLHQNTYPFIDSGPLDPGGEDGGVGAIEFEFESPRDGRFSLVVAREPPDGSFLGVADGAIPLFDGLTPREGVEELVPFRVASGAVGDSTVQTGGEPVAATLALEATSETAFRAQLALPSGFGAGVFTVHRPPGQMFEAGAAADPELAAFVQRGSLDYLEVVRAGTNFSSLVAPGLFVVHQDGEPLFTLGERDRGLGLEPMAEDGNPYPLAAHLAHQDDTVQLFPEAELAYTEGSTTKDSTSYSFVVFAAPGDRLSLVGMLAQTNDRFVATAPTGFPLFDADTPIEGDLTHRLFLWEAGTEVDERPGFGPNQAPRQAEPNSGESESKPIDESGEDDGIPPLEQLLRLTVETG